MRPGHEGHLGFRRRAALSSEGCVQDEARLLFMGLCLPARAAWTGASGRTTPARRSPASVAGAGSHCLDPCCPLAAGHSSGLTDTVSDSVVFGPKAPRNTLDLQEKPQHEQGGMPGDPTEPWPTGRGESWRWLSGTALLGGPSRRAGWGEGGEPDGLSWAMRADPSHPRASALDGTRAPWLSEAAALPRRPRVLSRRVSDCSHSALCCSAWPSPRAQLGGLGTGKCYRNPGMQLGPGAYLA